MISLFRLCLLTNLRIRTTLEFRHLERFEAQKWQGVHGEKRKEVEGECGL